MHIDVTLRWPRHCAVRVLSLAIARACRHWTRIWQADSTDSTGSAGSACSPDDYVRLIMLDEERARRRDRQPGSVSSRTGGR